MINPDSTIVGVVAKNSIEYVSTVFDLLGQGYAVVNVKSKDDDSRLTEIDVSRVIDPGSTAGWYCANAYKSSQSDGIAQILYTSGTEGKPKGIGISHKALANTTRRLIDVMEIDETIREYVGIPVYYSFGFGRCRVVSQAGGQFFVPENGFNPMEIVDLLSAGEINAISAVPTLWRTVLECAEMFVGLGERVKWIEIGSQYMSRTEKETLKTIFPNARIVQHYGLTEASRTTFLVVDEAEGSALESVGRCTDQCEVGITDEGTIKIRGPHVASCVYTDAAGAIPLTDENGWFRTNDLGRIEQGYLYYGGRSDDLINCGGVKLSPELLEQKLYERFQRKSGLAITGVDDPLRGQCVLACYLTETGINSSEYQVLLDEILAQHGVRSSGATRIWACDAFPVTATGKLKRKQLAADYITSLTDDTGPDVAHVLSDDDADIKSMLVELWRQALKLDAVPTDASFYDIGGDSLSSISVALKMEKLGVPRGVARELFAGRSIDEISATYHQATIAGSPKKRSFFAGVSQSVNVSRGLLVLMVVAAHWMPGVLERLPAAAAEWNTYFATLYSFGTPGFAIVFGVGVGMFYYSRYLQSPQSLNRLILRNAAILLVGMLLLASVRLLAKYLDDASLRPIDVANSLYSVISFYLFAVLSVPLWFKFSAFFKNSFFALIIACIGLYMMHLWIDSLAIEPSANAFLQYFNLQLTAKYNYFEMSAGVFSGLILGNFIRQYKGDADRLVTIFLKVGLVAVCAAIVLTLEMGHFGYWSQWPKPIFLWSWPLYFGLACFLLGATLKTADASKNKKLAWVMNVVACVGMLAFPMFIGHELVLPVKAVLGLLEVPFALAISLGGFLLLATLAIRKLYNIYYASSESAGV